MKLQIEKIKSYVGFAIKSRNICFGTDDIIKLKDAGIVLFSSKLGNNSRSKLTNFLADKNIEFYEIEEEMFQEIGLGKNILAFAVTDKNLAGAVSKNIQK